MSNTTKKTETLTKGKTDKDKSKTTPHFINVKKFYNDVIKSDNKWNYYENEKFPVKDIEILNDAEKCHNFIEGFIIKSGKAETVLFSKGLKYLKKNNPQRCCHIVSTFFLGIALYHKRGLKSKIKKDLFKFEIYKEYKGAEIDRQFSYIWFMITLFHDLGYMYEDEDSISKELDNHSEINDSDMKFVPDFYSTVYENYYKYRDRKDHGIVAGCLFYEDMPKIRKYNEENPEGTNLKWDKSLDEVYHATAWIIIAHNIWFHRKGEDDFPEYSEKLKDLNLNGDKDSFHHFKEYRIPFKKHPLLFLFCLIDAIDPIKSTTFLSDIKIAFEKINKTCSKIVIRTNDKNYINKIKGINSWLTPADEKDKNTVEIQINYP